MFVLFLSQALAQTNNLKEFCRYGERLKYTQSGHRSYVKETFIGDVLEEDDFPWGVCFIQPDFISSKWSQTSSREDEWTKDAMQEWNVKYQNYKYNRWGSVDVVGIPRGPVFVKSCDRNRYNIIYTLKEDLGKKTLGRYTPVDDYWNIFDLGRYFYVIITMNSRENWDRELFINVMMHELGHALGLSHKRGENSEIMVSKMRGSDQCDKDAVRERICTLKDFDIEQFLVFYDPAKAETRANYEARIKAEMERLYFEQHYACYWNPRVHCP